MGNKINSIKLIERIQGIKLQHEDEKHKDPKYMFNLGLMLAALEVVKMAEEKKQKTKKTAEIKRIGAIDKLHGVYTCTKCDCNFGMAVRKSGRFNFCPNCGAKFDVGDGAHDVPK